MTFTFEQVIALGTLVITGLVALFGAVRYVLGKQETLETRIRGELEARSARREAEVAELHRRADALVKELGDHREHVARTYATVELMRDVERRITEALTATEARITAQLARIDRRMDRQPAAAGAGE